MLTYDFSVVHAFHLTSISACNIKCKGLYFSIQVCKCLAQWILMCTELWIVRGYEYCKCNDQNFSWPLAASCKFLLQASESKQINHFFHSSSVSHVKFPFKWLVIVHPTSAACRMPSDLNRFVPVFSSLLFKSKGMIMHVGKTCLESRNKKISEFECPQLLFPLWANNQLSPPHCSYLLLSAHVFDLKSLFKDKKGHDLTVSLILFKSRRRPQGRWIILML